MKHSDPKGMNTLLADYGDSSLRKIVRHAERLLGIEQILYQYLPETLKPHCHIGQSTVTQLTVFVDSAAWLMQLRYLKPQLLRQLKTHPQCAYLQDIQWRIQPVSSSTDKAEPKPIARILSAETKSLLKSIANSISNPALKKSLLKLGS